MTIPTQAMIGGDFSRLLGPSLGTINGQNVLANAVYDPRSTTCLNGCAPNSLAPLPGVTPVYSRTMFPGNRIPVSAMDPASVKIASLYPAPNQPVPVGAFPQNDFFTATPGSLKTDQGDGRVDYRIDEKNSIFGTISWSDTSKTSVPPFQGLLDGGAFEGSSEVTLGRNAQLSYTRAHGDEILHWFDTSKFTKNAIGTFGSSGRNVLDGPGTAALNLSLSRRFRLAEYKALQFRWESFNVMNHANFNLPQTQVDVINGATINAAKAPRQMQLALRLEF